MNPRYRLAAQKRGCQVSGETWTPDPERASKLSAQPAIMDRLEGSYPAVAARAVSLNRVQIQSGFVDYLYAPELIG